MATKPKILRPKIDIAKKLREHCLFKANKSYVSTFWSGNIQINGYDLYIYFQYYVRKVGVVDFVIIRNKQTQKELTKTQLLELLRVLN